MKFVTAMARRSGRILNSLFPFRASKPAKTYDVKSPHTGSAYYNFGTNIVFAAIGTTSLLPQNTANCKTVGVKTLPPRQFDFFAIHEMRLCIHTLMKK